jgi:predicted RNase H-like nuclease
MTAACCVVAGAGVLSMTAVGVGGGCGGWIGVAVGLGETPPHPASNKVTSTIPISRRSFSVFILASFLSRNSVYETC